MADQTYVFLNENQTVTVTGAAEKWKKGADKFFLPLRL